MLDFKSIDDLARRLSDLVPSGLDGARADLEKNFRAALQAGLGRLDLVTREDFDVQRAVLLRTREKLERLEQRVRELETPSGAEH
jgi:BMFP domain-containing protein YqiC